MKFANQKDFDDYCAKIKAMTPQERVEYFNKNREERDSIYYVNTYPYTLDPASFKAFNDLIMSPRDGEVYLKLNEASDGYGDFYLLEMSDGEIKLFSKSGQHSFKETPLVWLEDALRQTKKNLFDLETLYNNFISMKTDKH